MPRFPEKKAGLKPKQVDGGEAVGSLVEGESSGLVRGQNLDSRQLLKGRQPARIQDTLSGDHSGMFPHKFLPQKL